jgi:thiamine pyrophosphate-dependent acetolactate synthase large subunit-like protein
MRRRLDAGTYGTMGAGLGIVIAACVVRAALSCARPFLTVT